LNDLEAEIDPEPLARSTSDTAWIIVLYGELPMDSTIGPTTLLRLETGCRRCGRAISRPSGQPPLPGAASSPTRSADHSRA